MEAATLNAISEESTSIAGIKNVFDSSDAGVQSWKRSTKESSNTYDSLGEAYMNAGDRANAVANYQESLRLNPRNSNGAMMLRKLTSP